MFRRDRAQRPAPRRAMLLAGVATIAFSLVLSIAPAMAAKGGNAGVAKIHDASTGLEAEEQANEAWVCTFWVGFYASNPAETGSWQILSWPPTGDGTVLVSGTYDTSDDGVDATADQSLGEGHYRLVWQTDGDNNEKHKAFWVECADPEEESEPTQEAAPTDQPTPTEEAAPTDQATPTEEAAPTGEPTPTEEATPTPEAEPSGEEQSVEETPPADETPPAEPTPTENP
ncbi:MAG TPA: hypothetical protein VFY43_02760, partial [Candidatus Limnocylindria bacterium]|nr:hypothetical protein [Candidatus Limnocylindria bacterium]